MKKKTQDGFEIHVMFFFPSQIPAPPLQTGEDLGL